MAHEIHINLKMEATLLDEDSYNKLCNGYLICITIQSGWRVEMKLCFLVNVYKTILIVSIV